jgi:hypothetical protein
MLYCDYCDYLIKLCNNDESGFCRNFMCLYSNYILTQEIIEELPDHPCYFANSCKSIPTR